MAWRARDTLRKLPSIDSSEPCIVVAGSPNVGKFTNFSLSSGEPEIASYPFTTKQLHLGHLFIEGEISDGRHPGLQSPHV